MASFGELSEMNLECREEVVDGIERLPTIRRAYRHEKLIGDDRVLHNLLTKEDAYMLAASYFMFQQDLKPFMRKIVTKWMLDVCVEQQHEEEVFTVAVNLMDRFLASVQVKKRQLQLLASVCMFIASKMMDTVPFTASRLATYTDNAITAEELKEWELIVIQVLRFDVCAITAHDFVDYLLARLPVLRRHRESIRRHTQTFIALCTTELNFMLRPPSVIATACISCAAYGLIGDGCCRQVTADLHKITGIDEDCIRSCQEEIELALKASMSPPTGSNTDSNMTSDTDGKCAEKSTLDKPTTPTDIREVHPE